MATKVIQWNTGTGNITLTYTGEGDGTIVVSSDQNNLSVARSQQITVKTTDGSKSQTVTISQAAGVRNYLKFTALQSGTFTLTIPASVTATHLASVSYSLDNGATWVTTQNSSSAVTITTPTVAEGGTVLWKGSGTQTAVGTSANQYSIFSSTGSFAASGNIMSLLYQDTFENELTLSNQYAFTCLFYHCSNITTPPELPATTINSHAYRSMFNSCTSLTTAPELPAMTAKDSCYMYMFKSCSSLITAPELPATTLESSCYNNMFNNCTALENIPSILPATTLASACYREMFGDCPEITTAPELPAKTLAQYCYYFMFSGCSNLAEVKCLATDISASNCTQDWLKNVAVGGTFYKHPLMESWQRNNNGIPNSWTVVDADD